MTREKTQKFRFLGRRRGACNGKFTMYLAETPALHGGDECGIGGCSTEVDNSLPHLYLKTFYMMRTYKDIAAQEVGR